MQIRKVLSDGASTMSLSQLALELLVHPHRPATELSACSLSRLHWLNYNEG